MKMNLLKGQSKTISLETIIKGPQSFKDKHKALIVGFGNYHIDISNELQIPFSESDYAAKIKVTFENIQNEEKIKNVEVISKFNNHQPLDITQKAKSIQFFKQSVIYEYKLNQGDR